MVRIGDGSALDGFVNAASPIGGRCHQPERNTQRKRIASALPCWIAVLSHFRRRDSADMVDEIDLNPVIVHDQGKGLIVDALIVKR